MFLGIASHGTKQRFVAKVGMGGPRVGLKGTGLVWFLELFSVQFGVQNTSLDKGLV